MAFGSQLAQWFGTPRTLVLLGEQAVISAAGTTQGTAAAITTANAVVGTVSAFGAGVILPVTPAVSANDRIHVANQGANTLACYPPVGGALGKAAANVPAMIASGKAADFYCIDGTNYSAILSA